MPSLVELREELNVKRDRLASVYEEAGPDIDLDRVTSIQGDAEYKRNELKRWMDEINDLGAEHSHLSLLDEQRRRNELERQKASEPVNRMLHSNGTGGSDGGSSSAARMKSVKQYIAESKSYRALVAGQTREATIDLPYADFKTLITLTTISPQTDRLARVESIPIEERTIADLMLQGTTTRPVIEYYEETTFDPLNVTTGAQATLEGAAKTEGEIAWTLRTENVRKIAWWLPLTDEALADNEFLEGQIKGRLAFGVRRREEQQIISGSGTAPQIRGLLNRVGIQTQARGTDPAPDAIYRAMQKIRGSAGTGFAEPTGAIFHPTDWTNLKLLKTADGQYLYGSPAEEAQDRIWGLSVRQTTAMTADTALVGAFRPHCEVLRRTGISIVMSTEHASYAVENKVAIIAEERLALAVYRPSALCTVTDISP